MTGCLACPDGVNSSIIITAINKQIRRQVRVPSSLFMMNLGSLTASKGNLTESSTKSDTDVSWGVKHNSYDRYLARKKGETLKTHGLITNCTC